MKRYNETSSYYPLFLDIRKKKCVVVGGGKVALRKVEAFLEHGANVEVISPVLCPELIHMAQSSAIRTLQRSYEAGDLKDALIAIAATDNTEINEGVADEARRRGILVNVVDDPQHSDFIVPSYFKRGDITIAVSTSGRSPALARKIRSKLENDLGDEYTRLVLLVSEVRSELKRQKFAIDSNVWQEVLDLNLLTELLRNGREQEAKDTLLSNLKSLSQREL